MTSERNLQKLILHCLKDYYFRNLEKENYKYDERLAEQLNILEIIISELTNLIKQNDSKNTEPQ
jgi:hypothetical protein